MLKLNIQNRKRQINGMQLLMIRKKRREIRMSVFEYFKKWLVLSYNDSLKLKSCHDILHIFVRREIWRKNHFFTKWLKYDQFKSKQYSHFESILHLNSNTQHRNILKLKFTKWLKHTYKLRCQVKTLNKMFRLLESNRQHIISTRFSKWYKKSLRIKLKLNSINKLNNIFQNRHVKHNMSKALYYLRMNVRFKDIRSKSCRVVKHGCEKYEMQAYRRGWYLWRDYLKYVQHRINKMTSVVVSAHKRYIKLLIQIGFMRWQHKLTFFDDSSSKIRRIVKNAMRTYILKKIQTNFGKWRSTIRRLSLHAHGASIVNAFLNSKHHHMLLKGWLTLKEHTHVSNKNIMKSKTITRGLKNVIRIFIKNDKSKLFRAFKQIIAVGSEILKLQLLSEKSKTNQLQLISEEYNILKEKDAKMNIELNDLKKEYENICLISNNQIETIKNNELILIEKNDLDMNKTNELISIKTKYDTLLKQQDELKLLNDELIEIKQELLLNNEKLNMEKISLNKQVETATRTAEELHLKHLEKHESLQKGLQIIYIYLYVCVCCLFYFIYLVLLFLLYL